MLMCIYNGENSDFFKESLMSISNQELSPEEVVIVMDGDIRRELYEVIDKFKDVLNIRTITNKEHRGLGNGLRLGVLECKNEFILRMDTDDISKNSRAKKQIEYMEQYSDISVLGSNILEFKNSLDEDGMTLRKVPENQDQILFFSKRRNPMNHMTVMLKRSEVLSAGNYRQVSGFEDYDLWTRMLSEKKKFHNLQESLVYARVGNDMISRRRGKSYADRELKFQKHLLHSHYINLRQFGINVFTRVIPRLLPKPILSVAYKVMARE